MNSKRRCANCKRSKPAESMLIQGIQAFCNRDCAIEYAGDNVSSLAKKGRKIERKRIAEKKRELKLNDRSLREKSAQNAFNAFIRLRDDGEPCISCGRNDDEVNQTESWKYGGAWDCGHWLTRGAHPELRFNENNAFRQCKSCNGGSGKYTKKNHTVKAQYDKNIVGRIGQAAVDELMQYKGPANYTCEELKEIELYYKSKIKQLKARAA